MTIISLVVVFRNSEMEVKESVFTEAIRSILGAWPALKIAIENGAGGHDRFEKVDWLPSAVEQWISENDNLDADEIEDCLIDILNSTFDLIIDDSSLPEVASAIFTCFRLCREGRFTEVKAKFCNLQAPQVAVQVQQDENEDSDSDEEMNAPENSSPSGSRQPAASSTNSALPNGHTPMEEDSAEKNEEAEDGWHEVKRGKSRRK